MGGFLMKKAVIFGAYHFLGFHICSALLEEGEEIIGITYPDLVVEDLDEKRMEIGRNANFSEKSLAEFTSILQDTNIEVLYFDFYTLKQLSKYDKVKNLFSEYSDKKESQNKRFVFLVNVISIETELDFITSIKDILNGYAMQVVYLPTLYGPWQPSDFLFQQIIEGKEQKNIQLNIREYTNDAIFIEDAVKEVVKQTKKGQNNDILLKSTEINHWQRCLEQLKWDMPKGLTKDISFSSYLQEVMVENKETIKDNLEQQKKHHLLYRI